LAHVLGTAISPVAPIVLKVFGGLILSIVAKPTVANADSPVELKEKFLMNYAHTV
jgi:hypothetical protein